MIEFYSTNFFGHEPARRQEIGIRVIDDLTHYIPPDDPRIAAIPWQGSPERRSNQHGRACAGYWKYHPELAMPDATITGYLGGNFEVRDPGFAERCLAELGDDDLLLMRHPYRDDIVKEEEASHPNPNFDGQDTAGQVQAYLADGHPRHWGLFHGGFMVRRHTPQTQAFNEAVWAEVHRWSGQDQLSLPYVLWKMGIKWHAWADVGQWHSQPFAEGWLQYAHMGQVAA